VRKAKRRFDDWLLRWHPWPLIVGLSLTVACGVGATLEGLFYPFIFVVFACIMATIAFNLFTGYYALPEPANDVERVKDNESDHTQQQEASLKPEFPRS
jgi:hypothetical protein